MFKKINILVLLSVAAFCFVLYRSVVLDITNDEAYSFRLAHEIITDFDTCKNLLVGTANTHWLNSVFLFIQSHLLGTNTWMLRIHSVFAQIIGFYALYKIFESYKKLVFIPIIIILLQPYVIDFFSLARGYALSISFLLLAIYHITKSPFSNSFVVYGLLSLSVFSSYTNLYFLISYGLLDLVNQLKKNGVKFAINFSFFKERIPAIFIIFWAIPNLFFIKYVTKDLEEGERNGYIKDTISYYFQQNYEGLSSWVYPILSLILCIISLLFYIKNRKLIPNGWKLLFELYFLTVLIIQFNFYFLNVPYPWGRTSIVVNIPLLLAVSYSIVYYCKSWYEIPKTVLISLIFLVQIASFLSFKKIYVTHEYPKQQGLKQFTDTLLKRVVSSNTKIVMSLDHYGSYINYYQYLKPNALPKNVLVYNNRFGYSTSSFPEIQHLDDVLLQQNYLLMHNDYHPFLDSIIPLSKQHVIMHFEDMQSDLIQITSP